VQRGCTGSRRANHNDRFTNLLIAHVGVLTDVRRDLQSHIKKSIQKTMGDPTPKGCERRIMLKRVKQQFERFEEVVSSAWTGDTECARITGGYAPPSQRGIK
jgi:hypothetical protein